ncbi:SigE family RNA polymerase sigma factor [Cryptosporangium aurantiacum]|uniref:RNA polymerase sigma-70 factor, sigma-E family n=1 Tax=Cryptosporangium aurantiacum TaxID=134849 RepID=A0A1M7QDD9_9ACTN|nr:SigE family RNA polymerase sigma factor [Cryptosporangium aurantiacum]SHN28847.1 RNA polymerase sigma-70 factor, sigma-E family [Cryptosporangium aurantiacum]
MTTLAFPDARARRARGFWRRGWERLARWAASPAAEPEGAFPAPTPVADAEELAWSPRSAVAGSAGGAGPDLVELYHHRRLALVRLAVLLVDDLPTAEDVVQDAFAAAYRRHGATLSRVDNPDAYLNTSVVNAARSVLRRRRTLRAAPPRVEYGPPTDERLLLAEEHREVLAALRRLPRRQREVLVLRYWSDLSEAQIADTLGISRGTVKSTASRALAALENLLEADR